MDAERKDATPVVERFQIRLRFHATRVPPGITKFYVLLSTMDSTQVLAKTSEAELHGGNCRWKDTVKHEISLRRPRNSFSYYSLPCKLIMMQGGSDVCVVGEVEVDLSTFVQYGNESLDQKVLPLENSLVGTVLHVTVHSTKLQSKADDKLHTTSRGWKGFVSRLKGPLPRRESSENSTSSPDAIPETAPVQPYTVKKQNQVVDMPMKHTFSAEAISLLNQRTAELYATAPRATDQTAGNKFERTFSAPLHSHPAMSPCNNTLGPLPCLQDFPRVSGGQDFKAQLIAAEEAIDELHSESAMWRKSSRILSKEVESLRGQLAEAMKQDKVAEMEIQSIMQDRDYMRAELEGCQSELEKAKVDARVLTQVLKATEDDLDAQKKEVSRLGSIIKKMKAAVCRCCGEDNGEEVYLLESGCSTGTMVVRPRQSKAVLKEIESLRKAVARLTKQEEESRAELEVLARERVALRDELDREKYSHQSTKNALKMLGDEISHSGGSSTTPRAVLGNGKHHMRGSKSGKVQIPILA